MLSDRYQKTTDNQPNVILTLVADGADAIQAWGHIFNESRYLPHAHHTTNVPICELEPKPNNFFRERTPPAKGPGAAPKKEPGLQLTFSNPPKNPELGYLLGSDEEVCDVYLGSTEQGISDCMLSISFNESNELILRNSNSTSINSTRVTYSINNERQGVQRKHFSWILLPEAKGIHVNVADHIEFWVVMPKHVTDQAAYQANCQHFKELADSATGTRSLPEGWSLPNATPASGAATPQAEAGAPFYLRTAVIGKGGFGVVYKARSMPDGRTVAVKTMSKEAWALEANVLTKISKTPHDNIVQFVGVGEVPKYHLVLGLAPGGNLEEQYKIAPFTTREIVLVLRQMLDALVFLHGQKITHRDLKPRNILCDSREHFRLADFGLAKGTDLLVSNIGTKPWMAPEIFLGQQYTSAVDVYALGLVIAWLMTGNFPRKYRLNEGPSWCEALIEHFRRYDERSQALENRELEQISLVALIRGHMLKMNPKDRESAPGCLERGDFLWWMLRRNSSTSTNDGSKDEGGSEGEEEDSEGSTEVVGGSEGEEEDSEGSTEEWLALEQEFAINKNDSNEQNPSKKRKLSP